MTDYKNDIYQKLSVHIDLQNFSYKETTAQEFVFIF